MLYYCEMLNINAKLLFSASVFVSVTLIAYPLEELQYTEDKAMILKYYQAKPSICETTKYSRKQSPITSHPNSLLDRQKS